MRAEVPAAAALLLIIADVGISLLRRRYPSAPWWLRHLVWTMRPFTAWALVNVYFRLQPWSSFKINPVTFPIYTHLWGGVEWVERAPRILAALGAAAVVAVTLALALRSSRRGAAWMFALWIGLLGAQLAIPLAPDGWRGTTLPWSDHGTVYLYAARRVEGTVPFVRDFNSLQPQLALHGRTHPPGATLLSYWTQDLDDPTSRRNVIVLLMLAGLNIPLMYAFGREVFRERDGALAAAALAGAMPAALAYPTFSLDPVFSVVFTLYLLLAWMTARRQRWVLCGVAAGLALFVLSMLTFAWSIAAAGATLFVALESLRSSRPLRETMLRAGLPPLVLLLPHLLLRLTLRFDYLLAYTQAYSYHSRFYRFDHPHDWWVALIGGQVDFLLHAGPVAACAFVLFLRRHAGRPRRSPLALLVVSVFAAYSLPLIFGPNPLKMETSRCWYWIYSVVVLAAVGTLLELPEGRRRTVVTATAVSLLSGLGMLLLMNYGV